MKNQGPFSYERFPFVYKPHFRVNVIPVKRIKLYAQSNQAEKYGSVSLCRFGNTSVKKMMLKISKIIPGTAIWMAATMRLEFDTFIK